VILEIYNRSMAQQTIEKLLDKQTKVILGAVDEKLVRVDKRFDVLDKSIDSRLAIMEVRILTDIDKKLVNMEERFNRKLDKLTTTLDKFLKRMTDMEDEFTLMKQDINRVKQVLKTKLGVDLL